MELILMGVQLIHITKVPGSILAYDWHPDGKQIAMTALRSPIGGIHLLSLTKIGFDAEVFEEGITYRWLFNYNIEFGILSQLTDEGAVFELCMESKRRSNFGSDRPCKPC